MPAAFLWTYLLLLSLPIVCGSLIIGFMWRDRRWAPHAAALVGLAIGLTALGVGFSLATQNDEQTPNPWWIALAASTVCLVAFAAKLGRFAATQRTPSQ
jgi:hypothetical protein